MKTLKDVPKQVREGSIEINGVSIMAFLADFGEDGGIYSAENILDAVGDGDPRRGAHAYIQANRPYLEELARVSKCTMDGLIGMRKDGRYWCVHQVAINYAGWLNPRIRVTVERAAIEFARSVLARSCEWVDKRGKATQIVHLYNEMIDKRIDIPPGKERGMKFGVMHNAIQGPIQEAFGGPSQTSTFKELNKVDAAMDAYPTPMLETANLARLVTKENIERKQISDLWVARDEAKDNAKKLAEVTRQLLNK